MQVEPRLMFINNELNLLLLLLLLLLLKLLTTWNHGSTVVPNRGSKPQFQTAVQPRGSKPRFNRFKAVFEPNRTDSTV